MAPVKYTCESCGGTEDAEALQAVHRIYLETDGEGRVVGEQVLPGIERWCVACRTIYPNHGADQA